eukprot:m.190090 g.190090  ORF g.190090 m.190090 type:complete len:1095 (-) comp13633_c0_seq1:2329-5613(-)
MFSPLNSSFVGVSVCAVIVALLLATTPIQTTAQATNDEILNQLCYQVSWNLGAQYPNREAIRPVTSFPAQHSLVQNTYCGTNFNAGDRIPTSGNFYTGGLSGSTCANVGSGELFYAYQYPNGASSNTGFEQTEADLLYFVVDADLKVSFILVHDIPGDPTGGYVALNIDSPDLGGKGVDVLLMDDDYGAKSTCQVNQGSDCRHWDTNTGSGDFYWAWAGCCTDGMMLGYITDLEWRFNIEYTTVTGIDQFKIGTYNNLTGELDFIVLDKDAVLSSGIEVKAVSCSSYCGVKSSCGECVADQACAWCPSLGCIPENFERQCPPEEHFQEGGCCDNCAAQTNCTACVNEPGCGWSYDKGECLSGSILGGSCAYAEWYQFNTDNVTQCLHPDGPVFFNETFFDDIETDQVVDWCRGHGVFDFDAKTCSCDYGYFGSGCEQECPGGALNPCNGEGTCDRVSGQCYCNCGFAGKACDVVGCPCTDDFCFVTEDEQAEKNCTFVCGRNFGQSGCTGSDTRELTVDELVSVRVSAVGGICSCDNRFWGPNCNETCPGIAVDGSGTLCGGKGSCKVSDGTCKCDNCYTPDATTGECVLKSCPSCQNGGQCYCDGDGDMKCSCKGQLSGELCEICACQNGGSCNSISGECSCPSGFYGVQCQFACTRDTLCHSHGTCNGPLERCDCDADYVGDSTHQCEFYCPAGTCFNGGDCRLDDGTCECPPPYFGDKCQNNTCQLDPCEQNAPCSINQRVKGYGYKCDCPPGYEGQNCEIDIDECLLGNDCFGADCVDEVNGFRCECKEGHFRLTDTTCIEVDECASRIHGCDENAKCKNLAVGYECVCNEGWSGSGFRCSDENECKLGSDTCVENAVCTNTKGSFECVCPETTHDGNGRSDGNGCQTHCRPNPCLFGGECSINADGSSFECECADGFEGTTCELNATVCSSLEPCTAEATCINGPVVEPGEFPQFTCQCPNGATDCTLLSEASSSEASSSIMIGGAVGGSLLFVMLILVVALALRRKHGDAKKLNRVSDSSIMGLQNHGSADTLLVEEHVAEEHTPEEYVIDEEGGNEVMDSDWLKSDETQPQEVGEQPTYDEIGEDSF